MIYEQVDLNGSVKNEALDRNNKHSFSKKIHLDTTDTRHIVCFPIKRTQMP